MLLLDRIAFLWVSYILTIGQKLIKHGSKALALCHVDLQLNLKLVKSSHFNVTAQTREVSLLLLKNALKLLDLFLKTDRKETLRK